MVKEISRSRFVVENFIYELEGIVMAQICIKIMDSHGKTLAAKRDEDEVNLVYSTEYQEGDQICVEVEEKNEFYWLTFDDGRGKSLVYITDNLYYRIPFGEKKNNMSPKTFYGKNHLLMIKKAYDFEVSAYRNLAINVWDQHGEVNCYPHALANVETRGEAVFAAMNAIDGITVSSSHGEWPYESWGINMQEDATFRLEFGRMVEVDKVIIYTRADYPHDNWWKKGTIAFSDKSTLDICMVKTGKAQVFPFDKKRIEWLELGKLIKSDEESPFPALTQIEVYGKEIEHEQPEVNN